MVQFSSVLFAQIRFLVQNLYKKNAKNNIAEVRPVHHRPPSIMVIDNAHHAACALISWRRAD